jgi:hypothetical protein
MITRNIFSNTALQAAVDKAVSKIPAGQDSAIIAHVDLDGASLTALARIDDHWTIKAACIKPWKGPLQAEAEVIASW